MFANRTDSFGRVTRALHWTPALLVLALLGLGTAIARMELSLSTLWLFSLHKSLGIAVLLLTALRLAWHRVSPPPAPLPAPAPWQTALARAVHRTFYVLLVAIPLSGWIGSGASGLDVIVFGGLRLPPLVAPSIAVEDAAFAVHRLLTRLFAALVLLHAAAALHRARAGDGTLRRMLRGG